MERGYVKLYRSIDQNELLENDNTAFVVFMKLLIKVDRRTGSYTTGRKKLATMCNLNPNTLYSALKRLEASTIIQQQSNKTSTTIHICNWWKYQQDDNKPSSDRQSAVNTKQEKKEKKKKEIYKEKRVVSSEKDTLYAQLLGEWSELSGRKMQDSEAAKKAFKELYAKVEGDKTHELRRAIHGSVVFAPQEYKPKVFSFTAMLKKWEMLQGHLEELDNERNNPQVKGVVIE